MLSAMTVVISSSAYPSGRLYRYDIVPHFRQEASLHPIA
jgi:hypothetical protein